MKSSLMIFLVCLMMVPIFPKRVEGQLALPPDGTITIYLRNEFGEPFTGFPQLRLSVIGLGMAFPSPAQTTGDGWVFSNLVPGQDYQVEVTAEGYQRTYQDVELPAIDGASTIAIVFLRPIVEKKGVAAAPGQMVLAPRAEKEVEHGLKDLRSRKFESAQKHLEKALAMAPGNPYVNYVMGMTYLIAQQWSQAEQYLAKSVSIDPKKPAALLALGSARLQQNENESAIQVLEQDVQLDAKSWKAEWMLANAYLRQGNYAKAQGYAEQALANGKRDAAPAEILLAQALAGMGEREKAADTFEDYAKRYPKDRNAAKIRSIVVELRKPPVPVEVPVAVRPAAASRAAVPVSAPQKAPDIVPAIVAPTPAADLPPKEDWAPPDVDAAKPFVISGAACSLPRVMKEATKDAEQFVNTLQQFSATEDYQSVEIKRDEKLETPVAAKYEYLVTVAQTRPNLIEVHEMRQRLSGWSGSLGPLEGLGGPALALAFHPAFKDDFDWTCEGLGEWKDNPAWVVHFQQRTDRHTSLLAAFFTPSDEYALPLKGRAWVSESGGEVLHLDTDLVHAMSEIGLVREHFSIDYEPVAFTKHKVKLWLPEDVDVYYQFRGHYIHQYHHYSKFQLFWVGASEKISAPKEKSPQ